MLGILFASLPHIFIGATLASLIMIKGKVSIKKKLLIFAICTIAVLSPDVLKVSSVLYSHAIWLAPLLGAFFTVLHEFLIKSEKPLMTWVKMTVIILVGHLFIDFIGNGARLLYPFHKEEYIFSIISKLDFIFILFLAISFLLVFFHPKKNIVATVCLIAIAVYFSSLTYSKLQLEYTLKEKYNNEDIALLITYPNDSLHWGYQVRTENLIVTGESPVLNEDIKIETRREI